MKKLQTKSGPIVLCIWGNAVVAVIIAFWLGFYPAWTTTRSLLDPGLRDGSVPRYAFDMHRKLSPKIARWADARIQSERPANLSLSNISGTEWPVFGSVFYLWATEELQDAWEQSAQPRGIAPKVYAQDAIRASVRLVLDPKHATWVKKMWGDTYLTEQNVFYRFCRIAALTAQIRLLDDKSDLFLLKEEVERLAIEIDASPVGLLEDYPGECYPGDVAAALACIRRADGVLGTDHSAMIARAFRAFDETKSDVKNGLPPYSAQVHSGRIIVGARGCSNAYVCMTGPELWPEAAAAWYENFEEHFWQENFFWAGFREFSKETHNRNWYYDVDSGPCVAGFGVSASAFGLAAARINGRLDHAHPLAAQMVAVSWTMPNGRMIFPALFSNLSDAPFLGEQCILYALSRRPLPGVAITTGRRIPMIVVLIITAYLVCALLLVVVAVCGATRAMNRPARLPVLQTTAWGLALLAASAFFLMGWMLPALCCILISQSFPVRLRRRS